LPQLNGPAGTLMGAIFTVSESGAKRWVFLYEFKGKQREAGLGSAARVTLATARAMAAEWRQTGRAARSHVR
jgi:hypothetical protein